MECTLDEARQRKLDERVSKGGKVYNTTQSTLNASEQLKGSKRKSERKSTKTTNQKPRNQ